jgi:FtsH-binding integral membrane protein
MDSRQPTSAEFFVIAGVCALVLVLIVRAFLPSEFPWLSLEGALLALGILVVSGAVPFCRDMWPLKRSDNDQIP